MHCVASQQTKKWHDRWRHWNDDRVLSSSTTSRGFAVQMSESSGQHHGVSQLFSSFKLLSSSVLLREQQAHRQPIATITADCTVACQDKPTAMPCILEDCTQLRIRRQNRCLCTLRRLDAGSSRHGFRQHNDDHIDYRSESLPELHRSRFHHEPAPRVLTKKRTLKSGRTGTLGHKHRPAASASFTTAHHGLAIWKKEAVR